MKRADFLKAVKLARLDNFKPLPYLGVEMVNTFDGCALDNKRRPVTMLQVASMICGHCFTFAGTWDYSELEDLEALSKRWDLVDPNMESVELLGKIFDIEETKCKLQT